MLVALGAGMLALRAGLAIRRRRALRQPFAELRRHHLRVAKPAVVLLLVGFAAGPVSAVWLRDWAPLASLHGWLGVLAAAGFVAAALTGRRIEQGRSRAARAHGLAGTLAFLVGALAAAAGMVLLP